LTVDRSQIDPLIGFDRRLVNRTTVVLDATREVDDPQSTVTRQLPITFSEALDRPLWAFLGPLIPASSVLE
jgi:hypothetical protein